MNNIFPSIYIKSIKIVNFNKIENFECSMKKKISLFEDEDDFSYSKDLIDTIKWCFCLKNSEDCLVNFQENKNKEISVKIVVKFGGLMITFCREIYMGEEKFTVSKINQSYLSYKNICENLFQLNSLRLFFNIKENGCKKIKDILFNKRQIVEEIF